MFPDLLQYDPTHYFEIQLSRKNLPYNLKGVQLMNKNSNLSQTCRKIKREKTRAHHERIEYTNIPIHTMQSMCF